jgi:hypothetical protein
VISILICPNFKLGHRLSWGTGDFNFDFASTSNWGISQVGAPVISTLILPQFEVGASAKLEHW